MYLLVGNKTEYIIYTYTCEAFLVYCTQGKNTKNTCRAFVCVALKTKIQKLLRGFFLYSARCVLAEPLMQ